MGRVRCLLHVEIKTAVTRGAHLMRPGRACARLSSDSAAVGSLACCSRMAKCETSKLLVTSDGAWPPAPPVLALRHPRDEVCH